MKRTGFLSALLLLLLVLTAVPAAADEYTPAIRDIDISVQLTDDGTAHVQEIWDVTVASGTEWYIAMNNMSPIVVTDLKVTDENGAQFVTEAGWDIDRTIDEKAGKCGIRSTDNGYELCWGVGSYGDHTYTVTYTMYNFVGSYPDADGFNHTFVSSGLTSAPQHVRVRISGENVELNDENADIYAFGYAGDINFASGSIVAESSQSLSSSDYVIILVQLNKGVLSPASQRDGTFAEVLERAKEGSDYGDESGGTNDGSGKAPFLIAMSFAAFCGLFGILASRPGRLRRKALLQEKLRVTSSVRVAKKEDYYRDLPYNGNLRQSYYAMLYCDLDKGEGGLLAAHLLRWLYMGILEVRPCRKQGLGGLTGGMENGICFLQNLPAECDDRERWLFDMLCEASGDDRILQKKEFYRWGKKYYDRISDWITESNNEAEEQLHDAGDITHKAVTMGHLFKHKYMIDFHTDQGVQHMRDLAAFRHYLIDYTLVSERQPDEVTLWDQYLIFAALFGIAEQVCKSFQGLYPDYFAQMAPQMGNQTDFLETMIIINTLSNSAHQGMDAGRQAEAARSSGGGGFSSGGGGGGASGGGGGGSR